MQSECASQAAGPVSAELENEADMDDNDGVASVMSGSVLYASPWSTFSRFINFAVFACQKKIKKWSGRGVGGSHTTRPDGPDLSIDRFFFLLLLLFFFFFFFLILFLLLLYY